MSGVEPDTVRALLERDAGQAEWNNLLDEAVVFEALGKTLSGGDVAAQMGGGRFSQLDWRRLDRPGLVLAGTPRAGTRDRGLVLLIETRGDRIVRIAQQNMGVPPQPDAPMVMDAALRARFDTALAQRHAMSLAYVDPAGRPQLSLRGSLCTFGDDALALWARSADTGLAAAVAHNPEVALLFRDEESRATYRLAGRARVVTDEAVRARVYADAPPIERQHDFAMLGAAVVIELDLVEGYAGLGPAGQIDPVRLVRVV